MLIQKVDTNSATYSTTGQSNEKNWRLSTVSCLQKVVDQTLIMMSGEQVELIQNKNHSNRAVGNSRNRKKLVHARL